MPFNVLISLYLEFAAQAWNPYLKRDKQVIEKVQQWVTRIPAHIRELDYSARREAIGLTSLETRRLPNPILQNRQ